MKVDLDTITHPTRENPAQLYSNQTADSGPLYPLGPAPDDPETDDDTTFLKLRDGAGRNLATGEQATAEARARQMKDLFDFCRKKDTREYWAQYARIAYLDAKIPLIPLPPTSPDSKPTQASRKLLVEACEAGEKLDPSNGFFPIMESGAVYNLGDKSTSLAKLEAASKSSRFDEYLRFESDARYRWFLHRYGYRGNQIKTMELAAILLPHLAEIKWICRNLEQGGKPAVRVTVARLGQLLMRRSTTLIGMLVGRSIVSIALRPPPMNGRIEPVPDTQVEPLMQKLQASASGSEDLSPIAANYKALNPPFKEMPDDGVQEFLHSNRSFFSVGALLCTVFLPLVLIGVWFKSLKPNLNAAAPYLAWLACFCFTERNPGGYMATFALASILFIPALFERSRRIADAVGICVTVCAIIAILLTGTFEVLISVIPFAFALSMQRFCKRIPNTLTASLTALVVIALAAGIASAILIGGFQLWVLTLTCQAAGVGLVPVGDRFRWQPAAGLTCIAATIVLGYAVSVQLAADKGLGKVNQILLNEAPMMRESLRIQ